MKNIIQFLVPIWIALWLVSHKYNLNSDHTNKEKVAQE